MERIEIKKIEEATTFDEIAEIRDLTFRVNEASGFDLHSLLTGGYKDPTHFIYELIQNAEDTKASKVVFKLYEDKLIFSHDGTRLFDLKDIRAITGIGDSTKNNTEDNKKDPTIGRFGIGFKAVFKICDSPKIYSGDYNFEINNLYVPRRIERIKEYSEGTHIILPFSNRERSVEDTYLMLHDAIEKLSSDTILFLRYINEISWETPNFSGSYKKKVEAKNSCGYDYYDCSIIKGDVVAANYLLFEKPLSINEKLFVSIAYRTEESENGRAIVMEKNTTKLVVFFPMDGMETFLQFKVNGPYATTNTRDNLSIEPKNKQDNELILNETIDLYTYSLKCIKALGLFNIDVLCKLPTDNQLLWQNAHSKAFYEATLKLLTEEAFLPTVKKDVFAKPTEALLVGSKELVELLSEDDTALVFDGRSKWLDVSITPNNKIYRYVNSTLGVSDIDVNAFIRRVKDKFLASKDDDWLIRFYKQVTNYSAIKDNLNKKFIRLENGNMVAPFTGDIPNVFLPRTGSKPTDESIKSIFLQNADAMAFFKSINITTMGSVEEVRQLVAEIKNSKDEEEYVLYLKLILTAYKDSTEENKRKIVEILKNEVCVLCEDEEHEKPPFYAKPTDAFIRYNNVQAIYSGIPNIYYLADIIADDSDGELMRFLETIGVNFSIKLRKLQIYNGYTSSNYKGLTRAEINELMGKAQHSSFEEVGYQLEHINEILATMTEKKSLALWNAIMHFDEKYFTSILSWRYGWSSDHLNFDAYFIRALQKAKWVYNEQGDAVSPNEIYLADVLKKYPKNIFFEKYLKFKPDYRKNLQEDEQIRLDLTDGLPTDYLMQIREAYFKAQEENSDFMPEIGAEECTAPIVEEAFQNPREGTDSDDLKKPEQAADEEVMSTPSLKDIINDLYGDDETPDDDTSDDSNKDIIAHTVSNKAKKIGDWGEKLVFNRIMKHYIADGYTVKIVHDFKYHLIKGGEILTVEHHNANGEIQKGYDISIRKGNEVIEYIEVKSRENDNRQYFKVSGTQWEFCKTLEKVHKCGDKYCVYLVTKAGTTSSEIRVFRNPYKNWVEGKLDADPVCIIL